MQNFTNPGLSAPLGKTSSNNCKLLVELYRDKHVFVKFVLLSWKNKSLLLINRVVWLFFLNQELFWVYYNFAYLIINVCLAR